MRTEKPRVSPGGGCRRVEKGRKVLTQSRFFGYTLMLQGCLCQQRRLSRQEQRRYYKMLWFHQGGAFFMKRTFQPKKRHRATKHGFLARSKSSNGRKVLAARRAKGRAKLAA